MTAQRWEDVVALFQQALEQPREERESFLDRATGEDHELRRRVAAMLDADANAHALLDALPGMIAADAVRDALPRLEGRRIGPYTMVREIGRGGMAVVYLAERADVEKRVALKLVTGGLASPERVDRFLFERRVLAQLEHPGIARLLDAGVADDGTPWLAMEYVEGRPIDEHCDALRLGITERLDMFARVCEAVAYAHRHLVVHRDIKPTNILVDADGQPRLLDFGIARLLAGSTHESFTRTGAGIHPMTPAYASPEQIRGDAITTASDVYQLGALLYQLLSGRRPHRSTGRSLHELQRAILEEEVTRPSQIVMRDGTGAGVAEPTVRSATQLAAVRSTTPDRLRRRLTGDLDNIVRMAMRPEPQGRYESAQQLCDDVRRHVIGRPVHARPGTFRYRATKFVARHRAGTAMAVSIVIAMAGFTLSSIAQARRVARERDRAEQVSAVLVDLFASSDPTATGGDTAITVRSVLERGLERVRSAADLDAEVRARLLQVMATAYRNLGFPAGAVTLQAEAVRWLSGALHPRDSTLLAARRTLGTFLVGVNRESEAILLFDSVLDLARRRGSQSQQQIATILIAKAYAHQSAGDDRTARPLYEDALAIYRTVPDPDPAEVETTLSNLGWIARRAGDLDVALTHFREILDRRANRLGADHPLTARSMSTLADALADQDSLAEAEGLAEQSLAILRRTYPSAHPEIAGGLAVKAGILRRRGDLAGAEALQREALSVLREIYGEQHVAVAQSLADLAGMVQRQGRLDEAAVLFRDAADRFSLVRGDADVSTAVVFSNLAWTEYLRRRLVEAEALYRRSVPVLDSAWAGSGRASSTLVDFATVLLEQGEFEEAEAYARRAWEQALANRPPNHVDVIRSQRTLGACLINLRRFAEAEPILLDAHQKLLDGWGATSPFTISSAQALVRLYELWGRRPDADRYRARPGG
ncbi:MAG: serine/threonine-protein kinase [Gemmatimonadetes bacterium]|nr:serine/threonine-protein kinase [Gemmatimonadota bacterium]